MVSVQIRLPRFFCTGRALARARVRAQPQQYKQSYNSMYKNDDMAGSSNNSIEINFKTDKIQPESESEGGNRVMVVVDFSLEAKNALQWALSHTVQTRDTVSLLFLTKQGAKCGERRAYELLGSMKEMCEMRRPGVSKINFICFISSSSIDQFRRTVQILGTCNFGFTHHSSIHYSWGSTTRKCYANIHI